MRTLSAVLIILLAGAVLMEGKQKKKKSRAPVRLTLTKQAKRPSLRIKNYFRADLRVKLQTDWRGFEPESSSEEPLFDLHRARIGVEGDFARYFEYELEYELGKTAFPWRDAYVNFRPVRWLQFRGGKFKIPFSMDQLQGPTRMDFVYRSRLGALLAPGRDIGGEVHGRFGERTLNYQMGVFRHDGEIPYSRNDTEPGAGITYAARLTGMPLSLVRAPRLLQPLVLGAAFTTSQVEAAQKGLRGRTLGHETFFPARGQRMFVNGQRRRLGAELLWAHGPFSVKSELAEDREERKGQGLTGGDIPDLISRGWYTSGTWVVTGQPHSTRDEPKAHVLSGHGLGAVEVATRYEQLRFGSDGTAGAPPARNVRATNIWPQSDRVWTFGVNWYMNRWMKTQVNAIHERLEDPARSPVPGRTGLWTWVVRMQYVL